MTLKEALEGTEYKIQRIDTDDEELNAFLFSLGCYEGEPITVVSHLKGGCVVSIKDGRYNIDKSTGRGNSDLNCLSPPVSKNMCVYCTYRLAISNRRVL